VLQLFVRLLLWTIALVLILIWLIAAGVVWIIEAIVAWRRKTTMPSFQVPRATSDPKFGRTAGAAVAVVAVLLLFGSGGEQPGSPEPVRANSPGAASRSSLADSPASQPASQPAATTAAASAESPSAQDAEAQARAERRAERRAAKARAERRAARRAAKARAERRRQRRAARERAAAAAAAAEQEASTESDGGCDPNYEGACLDANASDYDCEGGSGDGPKYTGTVRVVGDDPYDLDRDGDGIACDA